MNFNELQFLSPYLDLDAEFYDIKQPIPLDNPYLISFNAETAELIGFDKELKDSPTLLSFLNAELIPKDVKPFSMCYAGFQFGHYVPRLGDGRVHNLGKIDGWNIQLKGSGETLYARSADGRATIPSSIREYLISEAMHHLGIPTSRALAIIGSKTKVLRNTIEDAAITMRLSQSWVRFGTFEYFYYMKKYDKLRELAEYVIEESYPHLQEDEERFYRLFCEIVDNTAKLVAKWQAIGFCHGVMNTDNMSVAGLTIDYGPFSFLDDFNYHYVCNHTDKAGRYSYAEQVNISYWNLTKLSKAFSPLTEEEKMAQKLSEYGSCLYFDSYIDEMRKKLGLVKKLDEDKELIEKLISTLHESLVDYTLFFRTLSRYEGERMPLYEIAMEPAVLDKWLELYDKRLTKESLSQQERQKKMLQVNPKYVLKNYMLDKAIIKAKQGDFSLVEDLMYIAKHPYDELPEFEHFSGETPEEYKNIGFSCSS